MANYLYNGVELPDINEVWTDKETYPYAVIQDVLNGTMNPYYWLYTMGTYVTANNADASDPDYCINRSGNRTKPYRSYYLKDGVWNLYSDKASGAVIVGDGDYPAFWSSYDILRKDGTLYLAGSDPISLDGMTVIDWDGDTGGQAGPDGTYFKVSDTVLTFSDALGGYVLSTLPNGRIFPITEANSSASAEDGTLLLCVVDSRPLVLVVLDADKAGFDTGVYFLSSASDGTDYHTTKLAYTPSSGGEEGGAGGEEGGTGGEEGGDDPEDPGTVAPFGSAYVGGSSGIARRVVRICIGSASGIAQTVQKAYIGDENGRAVCWWGSA